MSLFTGYLAAGVGVLLGAGLLLVSVFQPTAFDGLRGGAVDVVEPVGSAGSHVRSGSRNIFQNIAAYYRAGSRNAELEREVKLARIRLAEAAATENENRRLKQMMGLFDAEVEPIAAARLIGSTASSTRRIAFISKGTGDGIEVGMPVRAPQGLVGRVLETGRSSARVLLLTDPESSVPVRRAQDDVVAFASGRADGTLDLKLINLGVNPLEIGDVMVTSGAGGLYRPGVAVAVVSELRADGGIARLLANPAATEYVMVEAAWQPEALEEIDRTISAREIAPADEAGDE